jgi:UDP-N-acetylglucosamine 2-epimerase
LAAKKSKVLKTMNLSRGRYCLATVHRAENTDDPLRLQNIFRAFGEIASVDCPFIVPIHPRTRKVLEKLKVDTKLNTHIQLIPPISYLDMICLETNAKIILTDSGGVQKEAYFAEVPCLTLRYETEWVETVKDGWNHLVGTEVKSIIRRYQRFKEDNPRTSASHYGDGRSGVKILNTLTSELN